MARLRGQTQNTFFSMSRGFLHPHGYTAKIEPQSLEAFMPDIRMKRNNCLYQAIAFCNRGRGNACWGSPAFRARLNGALLP